MTTPPPSYQNPYGYSPYPAMGTPGLPSPGMVPPPAVPQPAVRIPTMWRRLGARLLDGWRRPDGADSSEQLGEFYAELALGMVTSAARTGSGA